MTQTTDDVVDILSGATLFADLVRPQLESVAHIFEEQWFNDGERILHRGFTGSGFYLIIEGTASVRFEDHEIETLGRGDFFGEGSVLLGEAPSADVCAVGGLRCLVLGGSQLQEFLLTYPPVMYRMLQAEAMKLRKTVR